VEQCIERGWAMDLSAHLSPGFTDQFIATAIKQQKGGIFFCRNRSI
jgi:hypothetical protein